MMPIYFMIILICMIVQIKKPNDVYLWIQQLWMLVFSHMILFHVLIATYMGESIFGKSIGMILSVILLTMLCLLQQIHPVQKSIEHRFKVNMLSAGAHLIQSAYIQCMLQILCYILLYFNMPKVVPIWLWYIDGMWCALYCLWLFFHGSIRILCSSYQFRLLRRGVVIFLLCIPIVHLFVFAYIRYIALIEIDYDRYRKERDEVRKEQHICETKYPILLLHGVGFRDMRYFNYWGRIPKALIKLGADIHYGNQEAWGTIAANGIDIKARINEIMKETGSPKVNIIAHSKGGLDARYTISSLGMSPYVASLTTMSTPHHGCRAIDVAMHIPNGCYRLLATIIDKNFTLLGDQHPDFYTASRQFSTSYAKRFNEANKDCEDVYYQSYMSCMSGFTSHYLLSIPYLLVRVLEGANDGLVAVSSAKWGNFRGVWRNCKKRGISHGDIIDLKREDYRYFDVCEQYVQLVKELKDMGF